MKNIMICDKEREAFEQIFKGVEQLAKVHNHIGGEKLIRVIGVASEAEKVHIMLYLKVIKDFIRDVSILRSLLEADEHEFIDIVTEHGKRSLEDVSFELLMSGLTDSLMNE